MRKAEITITDHNDGPCTSYYTPRLKKSSDIEWTTLPVQYGTLTGSPATYKVIFTLLEDDTSYDYEITRHCCDNTVSTAASGTFNSGT